MTQTIYTLARFSLLEALRTRIGLLALSVLVLGLGISWLAGQVAITETAQIQAALTASFLRFAAVFILAAFVVISQARESADKGLDMLLSLPQPRGTYYLGKLMGFVATGWLLALMFGVPLILFSPAVNVLPWTISLGLELSLVAAASLFFVMTLTQVPAALAALLGFYVLSRTMAALQLIGGSSLIDDQSLAPKIVRGILDGIAAILPRLDLFTQSAWLTQSTAPTGLLGNIVVQTVIYVVMLTAAGMIDLHRKNF